MNSSEEVPPDPNQKICDEYLGHCFSTVRMIERLWPHCTEGAGGEQTRELKMLWVKCSIPSTGATWFWCLPALANYHAEGRWMRFGQVVHARKHNTQEAEVRGLRTWDQSELHTLRSFPLLGSHFRRMHLVKLKDIQQTLLYAWIQSTGLVIRDENTSMRQIRLDI
jgi:hypothetical protein